VFFVFVFWFVFLFSVAGLAVVASCFVLIRLVLSHAELASGQAWLVVVGVCLVRGLAFSWQRFEEPFFGHA